MQRSTTVIVVPMTSTARSLPESPPYLVAVAARESGLQRDGYVEVRPALDLSDARSQPRAGRLSPEAMERVDAALRFVLGI